MPKPADAEHDGAEVALVHGHRPEQQHETGDAEGGQDCSDGRELRAGRTADERDASGIAPDFGAALSWQTDDWRTDAGGHDQHHKACGGQMPGNRLADAEGKMRQREVPARDGHRRGGRRQPADLTDADGRCGRERRQCGDMPTGGHIPPDAIQGRRGVCGAAGAFP